MEVVLIRHAQPAVDPGICYGSLELALMEPMQPEASLIVAGIGAPDVIVTSPAARARDSASQLIACLPTPQACEIEPRLREMDFGSWEGQRWDAIPREALDLWAGNLMTARPHGGETPAEMLERVGSWADSLDTQSDARLWVVSHAGTMRMLAAHWLGVPLSQTLQWSLGFGATCKFVLEGSGVRLGWWNRVVT